jgi:hypothetical protein
MKLKLKELTYPGYSYDMLGVLSVPTMKSDTFGSVVPCSLVNVY